jgi:hypothetical protein
MQKLPLEICISLGSYTCLRGTICLYTSCKAFYQQRTEILFEHFQARENMQELYLLDEYPGAVELIQRLVRSTKISTEHINTSLLMVLLYGAKKIFSMLAPYMSFHNASARLFESSVIQCIRQDDRQTFDILLRARRENLTCAAGPLSRIIGFAADWDRADMLQELMLLSPR